MRCLCVDTVFVICFKPLQIVRCQANELVKRESQLVKQIYNGRSGAAIRFYVVLTLCVNTEFAQACLLFVLRGLKFYEVQVGTVA